MLEARVIDADDPELFHASEVFLGRVNEIDGLAHLATEQGQQTRADDDRRYFWSWLTRSVIDDLLLQDVEGTAWPSDRG